MNEHVVLVDEDNNKVGIANKYEVHTNQTPLHRAFSLFIFNNSGDLLLQQRASTKKTWPNIWSNSVCGHPADGESFKDAAIRRADYELGIKLKSENLTIVLPEYRYRYEHLGVVENEFCPVLVAFGDFKVRANPAEVKSTRWLKWADFLSEITKPNQYSEWCQEEAELLNKNAVFNKLYTDNVT